MKKHSAWLWMAALAVLCMGWHFGLGWTAFQQEAAAHDEATVIGDYLIEWGRDTFENLQSEFWQLAVQFLVLAGVLKVVGLQAYEEDQEQIKSRLDYIDLGIVKTREWMKRRDATLLREIDTASTRDGAGTEGQR